MKTRTYRAANQQVQPANRAPLGINELRDVLPDGFEQALGVGAADTTGSWLSVEAGPWRDLGAALWGARFPGQHCLDLRRGERRVPKMDDCMAVRTDGQQILRRV